MSDPIRIGHADEAIAPEGCGCCGGTALATLRPALNRANLSAISFRAGDHASFRSSMLTSLASADHPALARLRTREPDDFSIALIDAWAAACDVLSFYQERLANEAFIGTATERLSITELARLTGYRLHPGAAAETDLAILMEDPPGAPADVARLTVPEGTRAQSQPGPEEVAQIFETLEDLDARVEWNALRARMTRPAGPTDGDTDLWLEGTPALVPGDVLLFLARERWDTSLPGFDADSAFWALRRVAGVEPAADGRRSRILLDRPLANLEDSAEGPGRGVKLFHLRDRAALFGFNAPHPLVLGNDQRTNYGLSGTGDWAFTFADTKRIHLDTIHKSFVAGSWMVMEAPKGGAQPFRITASAEDGRAAYAISGKAQQLDLDTDGAALKTLVAEYRSISVHGGSRELIVAARPVNPWIDGDRIEIDRSIPDLPPGRRLIVTGRRPRMELIAPPFRATRDDDSAVTLLAGARITLLPGSVQYYSSSIFRSHLPDGTEGWVFCLPGTFRLLPATASEEVLAIPAVLRAVEPADADHSVLVLEGPLGVALEPGSITVHANVVPAAHGAGETEILGHGDPARPFQKFQLRQAPVTHRLAPTETGVESTMRIRVDGVEWQEVPDLYQRGPTARVYRTVLTDEGATIVEFGDGISGARPTPGRDNITADYSKGLGAAGNLRAGQLNMPLDRPLGLKEVVNPLPATGGTDPETAAEARRNAPIRTLTLGRVVSLSDYRDFALGFPGIAKAEARWILQDGIRRILVTVAGTAGAEIAPASVPHANLLGAFRGLGDPLVAVDLLSYRPAHFRLGLRVSVEAAYDRDTVLAALEAHLRRAFGFAARDFGQMLTLSEIAAAAHQVTGLRAVDIDLLYRDSSPQTAPIAHARLVSQSGRPGPAGGALRPAEILTLHPDPLDRLEEMS